MLRIQDGVVPDKSRYRPFEVKLHFSGKGVTQACGVTSGLPAIRPESGLRVTE